ncbi:hypothetical protein R3P38DRAFT_2541929, partial [Favolaschia claudopus]
YPGQQYGLLYATCSTMRRTVRVPHDYGVEKIESTDDVLTNIYVPANAPPNLRDTSRGRYRVDTFGGVKLPYAYSIFYAPVKNAGIPWYGNILVMRYGIRKAVINLKECDALLVDVIVARYGLLQSLVRASNTDILSVFALV